MSKKLYQVKIKQGFNAGGRRRAGIVLIKNVTEVLELTDDQVNELSNDSWIDIKPYSQVQKDKADKKQSARKKAEGKAPEQPEKPQDEGNDDETPEEVDLSTKSFKELQEIATELELDTEGLRSKAQLIELIEANAEQPEKPQE